MSEYNIFVESSLDWRNRKTICVTLEEYDDRGSIVHRQKEHITKDMLLEVLNQETEDE